MERRRKPTRQQGKKQTNDSQLTSEVWENGILNKDSVRKWVLTFSKAVLARVEGKLALLGSGKEHLREG